MTTPPPPPGISHVSLSVRDLDASRAFYEKTLGLAVLRDTWEGEVFDGRECMLLVGRIALCLQEHRAGSREPFDPTRAGLDHLAFSVSSSEDLESWATALTERGVEHSGVKPLPGYGQFIELRDPDGILVELHHVA